MKLIKRSRLIHFTTTNYKGVIYNKAIEIKWPLVRHNRYKVTRLRHMDSYIDIEVDLDNKGRLLGVKVDQSRGWS